MTPGEVLALFQATFARTQSADAALMAVFDAGRLSGARAAAAPAGDLEALRESVAQRNGVSVKALIRSRNSLPEERGRGELAWIIRETTQKSLDEIARFCGYATRASARWGIAATNKRIAVRSGLREELLAMVGGSGAGRQTA